MRVLYFLGADGGHYGIADAAEASRVAGASWEPIAAADASYLLLDAREQLAELWRELESDGSWSVDPPTDHELQQWARDEVSRPTGRIAMWRVHAQLRASSVPQLGNAPRLSDLLPAQAAPVRTWVAFRLLDLHGDPVPDVRYELTLSDGSMLDGSTDGAGAARHDDIIAGGCTIEFPELPETFWEHAHNE
jgi:hypothetical protein